MGRIGAWKWSSYLSSSSALEVCSPGGGGVGPAGSDKKVGENQEEIWKAVDKRKFLPLVGRKNSQLVTCVLAKTMYFFLFEVFTVK